MANSERHRQMARLRAAAIRSGACAYGWYKSPPPHERRGNLNLVDSMIAEVCGRRPARLTDAPQALKFGITQICSKHAKSVVLQEQLAAALDNSQASREWLVRYGHKVVTKHDFIGD